jgi:hypothetical protein
MTLNFNDSNKNEHEFTGFCYVLQVEYSETSFKTRSAAKGTLHAPVKRAIKDHPNLRLTS